jgi:hypothetical protein
MKNEMGGHMACVGDRRGDYRDLVGRKPEGKRPLGRCRNGWEDMKIDLQ